VFFVHRSSVFQLVGRQGNKLLSSEQHQLIANVLQNKNNKHSSLKPNFHTGAQAKGTDYQISTPKLQIIFFETTPFDAYFIKQKKSFKRNNKLSNTLITKANTHALTGQHRVLHDWTKFKNSTGLRSASRQKDAELPVPSHSPVLRDEANVHGELPRCTCTAIEGHNVLSQECTDHNCLGNFTGTGTIRS